MNSMAVPSQPETAALFRSLVVRVTTPWVGAAVVPCVIVCSFAPRYADRCVVLADEGRAAGGAGGGARCGRCRGRPGCGSDGDGRRGAPATGRHQSWTEP